MDFLCREHSSVGLERLLDKQEVCGSNPHVPTSRTIRNDAGRFLFWVGGGAAIFVCAVRPAIRPAIRPARCGLPRPVIGTGDPWPAPASCILRSATCACGVCCGPVRDGRAGLACGFRAERLRAAAGRLSARDRGRPAKKRFRKKGPGLAGVIYLSYICTRNKQGSLAQLVQSVCLTSRGSGVRIPQLPRHRKENRPLERVVFLFLASARKQRLYGRLAKTKGIGRSIFFTMSS